MPFLSHFGSGTVSCSFLPPFPLLFFMTGFINATEFSFLTARPSKLWATWMLRSYNNYPAYVTELSPQRSLSHVCGKQNEDAGVGRGRGRRRETEPYSLLV